jgi:hypothetical protein
MTDRELRKESIRVDRSEEKVEIFVCEIRCEGPHTLVSTWVIGSSLPDTASETEIENATAGILEDDGYFQVCNECDERKPLGWMLYESICQGCAQANHGVVY